MTGVMSRSIGKSLGRKSRSVTCSFLVPRNNHPRTRSTSSVANSHDKKTTKEWCPSSVGFSGAGFLGAYHLGAAACFIEHGWLLAPGELPPSSSSSSYSTLKHASQKRRTQEPLIMLGASAGAITCTGIAAGVSAEDGMKVVLELAQRTKQEGGLMDVLSPGYSLIDNVYDIVVPFLKRALHGGDNEYFLRRIVHGHYLRIALTDRRRFSALEPLKQEGMKLWASFMGGLTTTNDTKITTSSISSASCYVQRYRNLDDALSAAILSSYIPGLTGPASPVSSPVVREATERLDDLIQWSLHRQHGKEGCENENENGEWTRNGEAVIYAGNGLPVSPSIDTDTTTPSSNGETEATSSSKSTEARCIFLDGGLTNVWPTLDDSTIVVSPVQGLYHPNPAIVPSHQLPGTEPLVEEKHQVEPRTVLWHGRRIHMTRENGETLWRMALSSDEDVLQQRFACGYDLVKSFLKEHGMLTTYTSANKSS